MTVLDVINKIKDIEDIQRELQKIADFSPTGSSNETVLIGAINALDDYICELNNKEVKEKNV